jgi:hypothetical protein
MPPPTFADDRTHPAVTTNDNGTATVTIGEAVLRTTYAHTTLERRGVYHWQIHHTAQQWVEGATDLSTRVGLNRGPVTMLATLCSYLIACAESGEHGENSNLFPPNVREWAQQYSDEINSLGYEITGF